MSILWSELIALGGGVVAIGAALGIVGLLILLDWLQDLIFHDRDDYF